MSRPRHPDKHIEKAISFLSGPHPGVLKITPDTSSGRLIIARTKTSRRILTRKTKTMKRIKCEREYDFTLLLTGVHALSDKVENALYDAGCDDGTIALRSGRLVITFSRTAPSMREAILSAIRDVRKARIGADVLRVDDCNLVTQSEIARRIGRSRQLVHQYITGARGPGGFPGPACEMTDSAPLWMWREVAYWLWENGLVKQEVVRDAEEADVINTVLELEHQKQTRPELVNEIMRVVATP